MALIPLLKSDDVSGTHLSGEHGDGFDRINDVIGASNRQEHGTIPRAAILLSTNPTANDTITIGNDVIEFGGAGSNINVVIQGSAALTLTELVRVYNLNASEKVFSEEDGTDFVVKPATTAGARSGGKVTPSSPNIALSDALTAVVAWNAANLNLLGGKPENAASSARAELAVTAAMVTKGEVKFEFVFTPTNFTWQALTSGGVLRLTQNDDAQLSGKLVTLTLAGGAVPDIQATDVVTVVAYE